MAEAEAEAEEKVNNCFIGLSSGRLIKSMEVDMEGFSKYFTFEELTDSEHHPSLVNQNRSDAQKYISSGAKLSKLLESIRHILGDKPVKINSGYRNSKLNSAVGSKVTTSSHTRFEAADIVPSSMNINSAFKTLMSAKEHGLLPDLRKVLQEGTWLHVEVSTNPNDYRGFWTSNDGNKTWTRIA